MQTDKNEAKKLIQSVFNGILNSVGYYDILNLDYEKILEIAYEDLIAYKEKDPSSKNDEIYILKSYFSYFAVLSYRIANHIYYNNHDIYMAKRISELAKIKSGIEIHPAAKIGKRFVTDHAVGTVIGETVIIGDDCYILQNVVLGATGIANNFSHDRHPILGNNVEIGSNVKIYGRIKIGDNVKIGSGAIIKHDIPSNSKIIVNSNYQILKSNKPHDMRFLGYSIDDEYIILEFSKQLLKYENILLNFDNQEITNKEISDTQIKFKNLKNIKNSQNLHISFDFTDETQILINANLQGEIYDNQRVL